MAIPRWEMCREGCGLHHRVADAAPPHDAAWLDAERRRLIAENTRARGLLLRWYARVTPTIVARETLAFLQPAANGSAIIGRHWIHPSPAAPARPRSAVTSGAPPAEKTTKCSACGTELGGAPLTPPVFCGTCAITPRDEVAAARAAREVPRLKDRAGPGGVAVDVTLEPPPPTPPYRRPRR